MKFERQEFWSGLPFLSPGDLPDPWIEPGSPALQADSLPSEPAEKPMRIVKRGETKLRPVVKVIELMSRCLRLSKEVNPNSC